MDPKKTAIPADLHVVTQDDVDEETHSLERGPNEPLELRGLETMQGTFGKGTNQRIVLVGKPVTINQLLAASR